MVTTTDDPSLASLVPQPSTLRNVVLVVGALTALAALALTPWLGHPTAVPIDSRGGAALLAGGAITSVDLDPSAAVTLVRVDDVPGAHVVDAWVVRDNHDGTARLPDPDLADTAAGVTLGSSYDALPAHVTAHENAALLVRWTIDDCTALDEGAEPALVLRNVVGLSSMQTLPSWLGPQIDGPSTESDCP